MDEDEDDEDDDLKWTRRVSRKTKEKNAMPGLQAHGNGSKRPGAMYRSHTRRTKHAAL